MQRQRRILFITLLGAAVALILSAGPASAQGDSQPVLFAFAVSVVNNDGGIAHADDVVVTVDGLEVTEPDPFSVTQGLTGEDYSTSTRGIWLDGADTYELVAGLDGYVSYITCFGETDEHGFLDTIGATRLLQRDSDMSEFQCLVRLDDIGSSSPAIQANVEFVSDTDTNSLTGGLLIEGEPLQTGQALEVERDEYVLSALPLDGFDALVDCEINRRPVGVYTDQFWQRYDGNSYYLHKVTDDPAECVVTYTEVSAVEVTIEERIYNTYGGTLELVDIATTFNDVPVANGDVVHVLLDDLGATERIAFSSNTPDGYTFELECFQAGSGENVYLGSSVDPWRWPGPLIDDLSAGDSLRCVNAMLQLAPETHTSGFILQAMILNNDGGAMTPRDAEIQVNGAFAQPDGWRSAGSPDFRLFWIAVEDVGTYEITASYPGYHVSVQCTEDDQGWSTKSFGPAPASYDLESLAFNGCVVFFDDVGELGPRLALDVVGEVTTQDDGGLLAGETLIRNGETIELQHSTTYALQPVQLAGFTSSFSCPLGDMDPDDTLLHVYRDILIECTVTYTAVETRLSVDVEVINNHGGTLEPSDFWAIANVPSGSQNGYVYSEVDSGYKRLPITCSDDASGETIARVGSRVALDPGQQVTCTVVYDDRPAGISFATSIDDPALDARPTLGATTTRSGQYRSRAAGEYVLDARPLAGYAFVGTQCVSGSSTTNVVPGESHRFENGSLTTCTYHFEPADQPVRVLFNVEIINDDQGIATASTPRITFGEITTRSGQFRKTTWGQRSLGALPLAGYELVSVTCTDRFEQFVAQNRDSGELLAAPGHSLTCTYTFDDLPVD